MELKNLFCQRIRPMLKGNKIRIFPTSDQQADLAIQFGHARYVYNEALDYRQGIYKATGKGVGTSTLIKRLPLLKKELDWLSDADSQVLQQSIRNLGSAYTNFFEKRARFPKKKKKHNRKQSIQYPQRVKLDSEKIYLPKVGGVRAKIHREIEGCIEIHQSCNNAGADKGHNHDDQHAGIRKGP